MKVLKRFLIIGMIGVLGLTGCSAKSFDRTDRIAKEETEKTEKKKTAAKEEKEDKEEKNEDKKKKGKADGTPVTSLTIDKTTVYLENLTLRELVIFLQKAGYSCDELDRKLGPNEKAYLEIENSDGDNAVEVSIYNPSNEEDISSNGKISRIRMRKSEDDIYFLNGKINDKSKTRQIKNAFNDLEIEYEEHYYGETTAYAPNGSVPTTAAIGEEDIPYWGKAKLPAGQEAVIEIDKSRDGWRSVTIELPLIYE